MKNKVNYSIDLETLGTKHNSYILSIGIAKFDINTGEIASTYYQNVSCANNKFKIDVSTVLWWLEQSEDARQAITAKSDVLDIKFALNDLTNFIKEKDALVWGNGATFDITILEHAYGVFDKQPPWKFWNIRDMRTLVDAAACVGFDKKKVTFKGDAHNALDDAKHQALVMSEAFSFIRNRCYLNGLPF